MKIDRHSPRTQEGRVKLGQLSGQRLPSSRARSTRCRAVPTSLVWFIALCLVGSTVAQSPSNSASAPSATALETTAQFAPAPPSENSQEATGKLVPASTDANSKKQTSPPLSDPQAVALLRRVLGMIVHGPAFHAKVRETVWTTGREVVGVGTYEQAGRGSGQYNLQVTMHDGDGKHRLQQISDGRLAWTRTEIAGHVALRRVDVGRLDEWVSKDQNRDLPVAPRLTVGAWAEMLTTFERDYQLGVVGASLNEQPVWVITGDLLPQRREQILAESGRTEWPMLFPTKIRLAVSSQSDPSTGFGELLPLRIEFRSDPVVRDGETEGPLKTRLITAIELYSIQLIAPPPEERFRFENREVNFVNETDRYIQMFGVHLTERQRRQLRR